jgi:hypothetical protein
MSLKLGGAPSIVAALSNSTRSPHDEQNRPFAEACAPHDGQNISRARFYHRTVQFATPRNPRKSAVNLLSRPLHLHRRAVRQNLGNALHHFSRVIPHANHRIRALLSRVLHHQLERIFARLFA